jgi:hypothetical protein
MRRPTLLTALAMAAAGVLAQPAPGAFANAKPSGRIDAQTGQVIDGLQISNPNGPCVVIPAGVHGVKITNSEIGPCGPSGMNDYGVWILQGASDITVRNNVIHDAGTGVKAFQALNPLIIERNFIFNIRGPMWNGQAVQFNGVSGSGAASRVNCNISDATYGSGKRSYEDHISMYKSFGSPGQPIEIAFNRIRGGTSKSGGGITVGDLGGGWITVHDNTVVTVANSGIGVAGGNDIVVENNRVDNRGQGPESLTHMAYFVRAISACSNISVRGNRGIARLWNWAETQGDEVPGYRHGPQRCANVVEEGNSFGDRKLSPSIFDEVPSACR